MWATLHKALEALRGADLRMAAIAVLLYWLGFWMTALRWGVLLRALGQPIRSYQGVLANLAFCFVNNVTPGRVGGEIFRVATLRHIAGTDLKRGAAAATYDRLVDLAQTPLFVVLALPILPGLAQRLRGHGRWLLLLALLPVLGLLLYRALPKVRAWARALALQLEVFIVPRRELAKSYAVGTGVWVADAARLLFVAGTFGVWVPPWQAIGLSLAASLGSLVPVMGGLGAVEGSLAGALTLFGVPLEQAIAITLLERLISYVMATGVGALVTAGLGGRRLFKAVRSSSPAAPSPAPDAPVSDGTGPATST